MSKELVGEVGILLLVIWNEADINVNSCVQTYSSAYLEIRKNTILFCFSQILETST